MGGGKRNRGFPLSDWICVAVGLAKALTFGQDGQKEFIVQVNLVGRQEETSLTVKFLFGDLENIE